MTLKYSKWFISAVFVLLLALFTPGISPAVDLTVEPGPTDNFETIQSALDYVTSVTPTDTSFRIIVERGTYGPPAAGTPITPVSKVPIIGRETAKTIINGSGTGTLFAVADKTSISIRNFTLQNAAIGIQVSGTSSIEITNNVFKMGTASTAIQTQSSSGTSIENNTFFENGTAVSRDNVGVSIKNNIFYNSANTVQISQGGLAEDNISFNLFFPRINGPKGTSFIPNVTFPDPDPRFVAPASNDFHIKLANSPAVDQGDPSINDAIDNTTSDIGAYGGTNADKIPFQVSKPNVTFSSSSATVSWQPNNSYLVTNAANPGSYNIYYNLTSGPTLTQNKVSPGVIDQTVSTLITGLTTTVSPPGQPVLNTPDYADGKLILSWSFVPDATGYKVHFLDSVTEVEKTIDVGNTLFYVLSGLVNGREYGVTVSAYSKATYHFKVTAKDNTGATSTPGVAHESAFSDETTVEVGSAAEGLRSSPTQTAFPDRIVAGPDLPNKGCFIATAAYGYYSAPQVQILRTFRDRFLITNKPGHAFVDWYYLHGPAGADFLNAHPWLKPAVRAALLPLVGGAWFMVETPFYSKIVILFLVGMIIFSVIARRKFSQSGRPR